MSDAKYVLTLTVSTIMLNFTHNSGAIADHRMGFDMMNRDDQKRMMFWGGRHEKRSMPYMGGQSMRGSPSKDSTAKTSTNNNAVIFASLCETFVKNTANSWKII